MSELTALTSLPAILPAEVRRGGKEARDAYGAALGFERMLVKQLTKTLTESAAMGGSGNGGSPAAYREMVSDGIADAITQAGGIGMAANLYDRVRPEESR